MAREWTAKLRSNHPLLGTASKIERAITHIDETERLIRAFLDTDPYVLTPGKYDEKRKAHTRIVTKAEPVPAEVSVVIGDAIHNLRAAFDLMASEIVELGGGDRRQAQFPVNGKEESFVSNVEKMIKGAPPHAVEVVRMLQPYHGGDNALLWQLHKLDALDKHRMIIPVGKVAICLSIKNVGNRLGNFRFIGGEPGMIITANFKPMPIELKEGVKLVLPPADREADHDPQFSFDVAFGQTDVVDGEAVIPTLHKFAQFTGRAFEILREGVFRD